LPDLPKIGPAGTGRPAGGLSWAATPPVWRRALWARESGVARNGERAMHDDPSDRPQH